MNIKRARAARSRISPKLMFLQAECMYQVRAISVRVNQSFLFLTTPVRVARIALPPHAHKLTTDYNSLSYCYYYYSSSDACTCIQKQKNTSKVTFASCVLHHIIQHTWYDTIHVLSYLQLCDVFVRTWSCRQLRAEVGCS